ncbi:dynein heavy chain 2, axonemal-like [Nasonia vitripennis]|uniref:Uncharacterized protein n=1 Tax=Nasonia vitripennis TaxID=7425 RepID=A0A7M7H632_NASVI|nr:dynein heavy chain 2, axonemal-like [Nasonia vitripennis]
MQGQRRDKGRDKPVADAHREYLDEEFSEDEGTEEKSERRAGREDGFSGNLSRATYAEKELDKLVNYVKDFTILSGLSDKDWNNQCIETIREFFEAPKNPCLTIFFEDDTLAALLSFPEKPVDELTYFVRKPFEVYSAEDFQSKILFGNVNNNVEDWILTIVNNVLTPIFAKVNVWPDSILCIDFPRGHS